MLLGDNGIETRCLALNPLTEAFETSPDVVRIGGLWSAPVLAERAARAAMEEAAVGAGEIDLLVVSTCTGYVCPGLSSYVAERLGLRAEAVGLVGRTGWSGVSEFADSGGLFGGREGAAGVIHLCGGMQRRVLSG